MKNLITLFKIFLPAAAILLLTSACNPFAQPPAAGVAKSLNGGLDWEFSNKVASSTSQSIAGISVSKLAFDPDDNHTIYAGTYNDGLFKSTDAAASWRKILSKILVYDFAINFYDTKILYAAGTCLDHGCVLKTFDGGKSWNEVYHEGSANNTIVRSVVLNPQNPNQLAIGTTLGTVLKSNDAGNTWQLVKDFSDRVNRMLWQNGSVYVLLKTKGLYVSQDSGTSFSELTGSLKKSINFGTLTYNQNVIGSFNQFYVDQTSPSLMYVTTDRGLQKTVDGGKSWQAQSLPIKPDQANAYAIAIAKQSSNIIFTTVGSTVYKSTDSGNTWQTQHIATDGLINYILIDPQLPQIVYGGLFVIQQ